MKKGLDAASPLFTFSHPVLLKLSHKIFKDIVIFSKRNLDAAVVAISTLRNEEVGNKEEADGKRTTFSVRINAAIRMMSRTNQPLWPLRVVPIQSKSKTRRITIWTHHHRLVARPPCSYIE